MSKILVIDDEQWLREMVKMALKERGHEIIEADNGTSGLERILKDSPDLIICDVNMSPMNGYALLQELRAKPTTAAIPLILMTGAAHNAGMRQGMELGADDYLPKPFDIEALYGAVDARLKKVQTLRAEAEKKLADLRDNISLMLPHELRTPLNGILAYGDILKTDAANLQPDEIAEMGQVIADSGMRLQRLIENFLIYAQIEVFATDAAKVATLRAARTSNPEKVIWSHAVGQAERAGRPADLTLAELANQPVTIGEDFLSKIVDEIVNNAFKYSSPQTPVGISSVADERFIYLTISNQGQGFDTQHIRKIGAYMQFERKVREQQGLGLGLTIAKRLAELHGGNLEIQSKKGEVTEVKVSLPLAS